MFKTKYRDDMEYVKGNHSIIIIIDKMGPSRKKKKLAYKKKRDNNIAKGKQRVLTL